MESRLFIAMCWSTRILLFQQRLFFCYNANVARERECGHAVITKRGTRDKAFFVIGGIWCKKWL